MLLRRSRGSEADRQRMRSRKSIKVALLSDRENKRTVGTENGSLGGDERAKVDRLADVGRLEEEAVDVVKVLGDLGMDAETQAARILHVLNKADLLIADDAQVTSLQNMFSDGVFVSAKTGDGVDDLLMYLDRHLGKSAILATIYISPTDGAARAWLHQNAMVKSSHFDDQGHEQILVSIDPADHARLCARWPDLGVSRAEA